MRINIDTDVLQRKGLSLEEFLILLAEYYNVNLKDTIDSLVQKDIVERSNHNSSLVILSNNTRNLVAQVLVESHPNVVNSQIDFGLLATKMQNLYPKGDKPGTSYLWQGDKNEVIFKLQALIAQHGFTYTEEEAMTALQEYLATYKDSKYLQLLPYFILKTTKDGEVNSLFMTLIENNRQNENNY